MASLMGLGGSATGLTDCNLYLGLLTDERTNGLGGTGGGLKIPKCLN